MKLVDLALKGEVKGGNSSLGAATSLGECGGGSLTGGRSLWAKKPGRETSIRWILGSPALIAWPASWNAFEKGLKSNTKWMAHSCPSSLIKHLRPQHPVETRDINEAESRSDVPFICKNNQGEDHGQTNKTHYQRKTKH